MNIKKAVKVLLSCVLAGALFTGCGGSSGGDNTKAPEAKPIKLGMITHLNANEKKMEGILDNVTEKTGVNVSKYTITFYENLRMMQMGIESGSVDQISVYESVAKYITATNNHFAPTETSFGKLSDSFCFAVRKDDTELKAQLDKAIDEMKSDGTLDKLVKDYITDAEPDNIPAVEIPMTEGNETLKVGVTGDLPPLDLVLPDGTPAGFNTAMLAEIAKRIGRNVELVDIDSGARAAALTSNQIDVIFWAVVPGNDKVPADIDKPAGVELSTPYFKDDISHLKYNK